MKAIFGALAVFGFAGAAVCLGLLLLMGRAAARPPLTARFDTAGPYLILTTRRAAADYAAAIHRAQALHPQAAQAVFDPVDLATARKPLEQRRPRYALVFIEPDELDVHVAWDWLTLTSGLDRDPFPDVRTGFITGATPGAANAFIERIGKAASGQLPLPGAVVDDLGPNPQAGPHDLFQNPICPMCPVLGARLNPRSISHGTAAFTDERLSLLDGAGIVHLGGHGHPERVDDGVTGGQAARLRLSSSVVFNGACYTGVTGRWFDQYTPEGKITERTVAPGDSFCLSLLKNQVVGYLAALHPDHGMPVYQEMEYLASTGAPLGDVIASTYRGVILGSGGRLPRFERLKNGEPSPQWTPAEIMLKGTASRVLFGDPALIVTDAFTRPPFDAAVQEEPGVLRIRATLVNPALQSSFTDTYYSDLAEKSAPFNDRALISVKLPPAWKSVRGVEVARVQAGGEELKSRLVGFAVEQDGNERWLRVQADVPGRGWMQGALRKAGATVELTVRE